MVLKNDPFKRREERKQTPVTPTQDIPPKKRLIQRNYQFPPELLARIDQARKTEWPDTPNQSEAIRRLLNEALSKRGL